MLEKLNELANKIVFEILEEARGDCKRWVDKQGADCSEVTYRKGIIEGIRACVNVIEQEIDKLEQKNILKAEPTKTQNTIFEML